MERRTKILLFVSGIIVGGAIILLGQLISRQEKASFKPTIPIAKETSEVGLPLPLLSDTAYKEQGTSTKITIDISYPTIKITGHPDVEAGANKAIKDFTDTIIDGFKKEEGETIIGGRSEYLGSSLTMDWEPMIVTRGMLSLRFNYSAYAAGAAHPNNMSRVLNYDLTKQKVLETKDLFIAPADAFSFLSSYSRTILKKEMRDTSPEEWNTQVMPGTEPTAENWKEVALTKEGLLVIFNPYQITPYAAGTQDILIDKSALAGKLAVEAQNALRDAE